MTRHTLWLQFAPGGKPPLRMGAVVFGLSAVLLLGAAAAAANAWLEHGRQLMALDAIQAQQPDSTAKRRTPLSPADLARERAMRQVAGQLTTPWADLLDTLESAPTESVAVLAVEPSVSKRALRLTAEAKSAKEMLAYLAALQGDPRLSSVVLASHQVQVQTPGTPVRFQIQAAWGVQP